MIRAVHPCYLCYPWSRQFDGSRITGHGGKDALDQIDISIRRAPVRFDERQTSLLQRRQAVSILQQRPDPLGQFDGVRDDESDSTRDEEIGEISNTPVSP